MVTIQLDCPLACLTCKDPEGNEALCTDYCSKHSWCGIGLEHEHHNCRKCKEPNEKLGKLY